VDVAVDVHVDLHINHAHTPCTAVVLHVLRCVVVVWLLCGCCVVVVWLLCGCCVVAVVSVAW